MEVTSKHQKDTCHNEIGLYAKCLDINLAIIVCTSGTTEMLTFKKKYENKKSLLYSRVCVCV